MSSRTYSRNAYESNLDGAISAGATDIDVDSATGLTAPLYLCIDPDDPAKREYIRVTSISVNTLQTVTRGLDGSAAGAQAHDNGAVIRAVPAHQHLDDIFDDIEALEVDQHAELHTVASHSDTTATGPELDTLTDGSNADALHAHDHGALVGLTDDDHGLYLKEKASGGLASEVPEHDHTAAAEGGALPRWAALKASRITSNLSIPTDEAGVALIFNELTREDDPGNHLSYNTGNGNLTFNTAGWYEFHAQFDLQGFAAGEAVDVYFQDAASNNRHFSWTFDEIDGASLMTINMFTRDYFSSGDIFKWSMEHFAAGAILLNQGSSWFTAVRLPI